MYSELFSCRASSASKPKAPLSVQHTIKSLNPRWCHCSSSSIWYPYVLCTMFSFPWSSRVTFHYMKAFPVKTTKQVNKELLGMLRREGWPHGEGYSLATPHLSFCYKLPRQIPQLLFQENNLLKNSSWKHKSPVLQYTGESQHLHSVATSSYKYLSACTGKGNAPFGASHQHQLEQGARLCRDSRCTMLIF